jgi:hypothetical protein
MQALGEFQKIRMPKRQQARGMPRDAAAGDEMKNAECKVRSEE